jgi:hypothetical protein
MTDAQKLIHGSAVSYQAEGRINGGEYGTLDIAGAKPVMLWSGLNASFGVDVEEPFAEIHYVPAHGNENADECVRNVKLGEDLPFHLETHPQADMDFPLLKFITGSATGFGDKPDSTSWMRELAGKYSVFTGVMFEDYKCEIPERGVVKETISGFAGDRAAIADTSPATTEAIEDTSKPRVWNDIVSIEMGAPVGLSWTLRTSAADNDWRSVTYGNGLFVAVATTGTGDRVMTSPDGITWTLRTSAADNDWHGVTYGNGLFVAVAHSGTDNRVMTSPDGITWTLRTSAADNDWRSVTYGNGLFVAVAYSGTGNRVMTSPDGITWTIRTSAADNDWLGVTYGNGLFVAVAYSGTDNRVMTSPDGITWTLRTSAADNSWRSVTYGNGLFVAVSSSGTDNRVMTSPDGITWTIRTSAADNDWLSVTYSNGLFVAVSGTGTDNRVMTSPTSVTTIQHCISDISFGFTNEVEKKTHPESSLTTKICGVRVVARKMFVSLKLTWIDQSFIDIVTGSTKQYLKLVMGTSPHKLTIEFGGLYFPKYIAKAEPKEVVGDTITCIVDRGFLTYGFT